MADDNLFDILKVARKELPEVDDRTWTAFEALVRRDFGARRVYIARQPKRDRLEALTDLQNLIDVEKVARIMGVDTSRARVIAQDILDNRTLAKRLGVTEKYIRQLKKLNQEG